MCWHREQAEHAVGPGSAVPHPEEVLRELRSRNGQPRDHEHRPQSGPHLPQSKQNDYFNKLVADFIGTTTRLFSTQ